MTLHRRTQIGYMFGQYKRLRNEWTGVLTGGGLPGGSLARTGRQPATARFTSSPTCLPRRTTRSLRAKRSASPARETLLPTLPRRHSNSEQTVVTVVWTSGYVYDPEWLTLSCVEKTSRRFVAYASRVRRRTSSSNLFPGERPWSQEV